MNLDNANFKQISLSFRDCISNSGAYKSIFVPVQAKILLAAICPINCQPPPGLNQQIHRIQRRVRKRIIRTLPDPIRIHHPPDQRRARLTS